MCIYVECLYTRLQVRLAVCIASVLMKVFGLLCTVMTKMNASTDVTIDDNLMLVLPANVFKQVAQLSQRNRAAAWISFGWVVDDGVGQ